MEQFSHRLCLLNEPFSSPPYSYSPGYFQICWHLSQNLGIEVEKDYITFGAEKMEIFSLVRYIFFRLRGNPRRVENYETVYQKCGLHRLAKL